MRDIFPGAAAAPSRKGPADPGRLSLETSILRSVSLQKGGEGTVLAEGVVGHEGGSPGLPQQGGG